MLFFKQKTKIIVFLVIFILTTAFFVPKTSNSQHDNYPKLANYYLKWYLDDSEIVQLAKWDVVILSPQALENNPQVITKLKQYNPRIKVLVYVLAQEINNAQLVNIEAAGHMPPLEKPEAINTAIRQFMMAL